MRECTDLLNLQYQINGFTFTSIKKMKSRYAEYCIQVSYPIPTNDGSSNPGHYVLPQQPNYPTATPQTPLLFNNHVLINDKFLL
ncbi:hypothetical protein DLAC_10907 [Tieghemostelium lacteum]|uniref:Uncharacterized protein n=1 Tax=Tieghemostelium lacteum TaxID=361077 RepID=A0A151Z2N2_TIELA|nr:hypothetical protein DLAC_10907 [Tieghemostelium lacteum]|eukprot:KYQ88222.1 hypothetical protein DLAC_10907 [Tieghemostelium lacteum]